MPTLPPQIPTPTLALSDSTLLQARIAALEAKVAALEAVITLGADGVTINSPANIVLKASKDLFIRAERDAVIETRGHATFTIVKSMVVSADQELLLTAHDHFRLDCGSAAVDGKKTGSLDISGGRITVKGTHDVEIKGSKVTQN